MDIFGYAEVHEAGGKVPSVRIGAFASRYNGRFGEFPSRLLNEHVWGRDPFVFTRMRGVSPHLQIPVVGTVDGHNLMTDSNFMDALNVDRYVPISPLFVRDLCGRVIYIGSGPEHKANDDWADYRPPVDADGMVDAKDFNPFVPLVVFPRYCRDVSAMPGADLLENVFLTKFRSLEMSLQYCAQPSGSDEDDVIASVYNDANLYPYKLRLDTFYIDGWKIPQTRMVFAKRDGIKREDAHAVGEDILTAWREREAGQSYEDWLMTMGGNEQLERWYHRGCTLIPTFDACNGLHVVSRDFELTDFWPGRAVAGLHEVIERRTDKSPDGTILQVLQPGYVTADRIVPAQVIISDGSGYVSPNSGDPVAMIPNINLPHQRALADWNCLWIPTHPLHFEAPAIWGWDLDSGRFLQLGGPLWDPLHYFYASVDEVLAAYENPLSVDGNRWLTAVPEHMRNRFYPVIPMLGFDVISAREGARRRRAQILPLSNTRRVLSDRPSAAAGYHPLPPQFEFELDSFWFPEMHPLNREIEVCPEELDPLICPVITPDVSTSAYMQQVDAPETASWITDGTRLSEPGKAPLENYPFLIRYLLDNVSHRDIMRLSPMPFLADMSGLIQKSAKEWWLEFGWPDEYSQLNALMPQSADAIWNLREVGADLVRVRHVIYQTNIVLYTLAWWGGANATLLQAMAADWVKDGAVLNDKGELIVPEQQAQEADEAQPENAVEQMRRERAQRPVAQQPSGMPEESA